MYVYIYISRSIWVSSFECMSYTRRLLLALYKSSLPAVFSSSLLALFIRPSRGLPPQLYLTYTSVFLHNQPPASWIVLCPSCPARASSQAMIKSWALLHRPTLARL